MQRTVDLVDFPLTDLAYDGAALFETGLDVITGFDVTGSETTGLGVVTGDAVSVDVGLLEASVGEDVCLGIVG